MPAGVYRLSAVVQLRNAAPAVVSRSGGHFVCVGKGMGAGVDPDLLEWAGVVGIAAVIFLAGRTVGMRTKKPPQPRYECSSCDHGIGFHKDRKGRCQRDHPVSGNQCPCANYIGDQPPPTYDELTTRP